MAGEMKTLNGEKLLIQIGDGANPETFAHDCLVNTERGIVFTADTQDFTVPNCLSPSDPAWKEVIKDGLSAAVNGAGMVHTSSIETFFNWLKSPDAKNCRVKVDVAGADGGGYWQGAFHLTSFEVTGTRKQKSTNTIALVSSGEVTWTDAA
jgi:predicted secreted protein